VPLANSHGPAFGTATGRVLAVPSDCIRASSEDISGDFGFVCFAGSPGATGDCVRVGFSLEGENTVAGILRLLLVSTTGQLLSACRVALKSNSGVATGKVLPDNPRCMSVSLPYPDTKAGQLCTNVVLGTSGACVSILYVVDPSTSTAEVEDRNVGLSVSCDGIPIADTAAP